MERLSVLPTETAGEILVTFKDGTTLKNVTVVDLALHRQLADTPTHIVNPARTPLDDTAFAAAEKQAADLAAQMADAIAAAAEHHAATVAAEAEAAPTT